LLVQDRQQAAAAKARHDPAASRRRHDAAALETEEAAGQFEQRADNQPRQCEKRAADLFTGRRPVRAVPRSTPEASPRPQISLASFLVSAPNAFRSACANANCARSALVSP
jgi:hypothetical protein